MMNNSVYFETSAKDSTNVEKAFIAAGKLALNYITKELPDLSASIIHIDENPNSNYNQVNRYHRWPQYDQQRRSRGKRKQCC